MNKEILTALAKKIFLVFNIINSENFYSEEQCLYQ